MTITNFDWVYFWETANYVSWYEYLVLVCFGAGWWFSVRNSLKTKQIIGKSFPFLRLIILGCCFGICHHLFVDLNFKIVFYLVLLCGAVSDYYVCRRLRSEQNIKERKKVIVERGMKCGSDDIKALINGVHSRSNGGERRHRRHSESSRQHSTRKERIERHTGNESSSGSELNLKEVKFDDIDE